MEKHSVESGNGSRLASLIDRRLRGNQRLFLVSVDAGEAAGSGTRDEARQELLALLGEIRDNVAASGVSDADLDQAIDDTIADVRAHRP
jgi:hypothetical protein